jgi:hypothetical protein
VYGARNHVFSRSRTGTADGALSATNARYLTTLKFPQNLKYLQSGQDSQAKIDEKP